MPARALTAQRAPAARSAWGATYTHCRTLMARFQGYAHDAPLPMRKLLLRWIIALPYLMRSHLADYKPGSDSLEHLLTQDEVRTPCRHASTRVFLRRAARGRAPPLRRAHLMRLQHAC